MLLHGMSRAIFGAQTFDGDDLGAVGLHRQREARARAAPIHRDRAGAAHAVLAAKMRAGEMQMIAQKVRQRKANRHGLLVDPAIHGNLDAMFPSQLVPSCPRQRRFQSALGQHAGEMPAVRGRCVDIVGRIDRRP